jgi:Zn-dependent protease
MFGKSITLFKLLGFKVKMDASWLLIALLITWSLAHGWFPSLYPDLPLTAYWWMGVVGVIGLFFSLVLHELSHSLVARQFGLPITGITLFIFGGVAEMETEPKSPKDEFLMAIAGPITSGLLAAAFYAVFALGEARDLPAPFLGTTHYLASINAIIAIFNLLPAFPLDGGRALRATLWYWKHDLRWATRVATRLGSGFGTALIVLGFLNVIAGNFIGGIWWFLIGMFLRGAAIASYQQLLVRRALEGEPVSRFMTLRPVTVPLQITVTELVENFVYVYYHDMFPVADGARLLGCVSTRDIKKIPHDQWDRRTVGDIFAPCSAQNVVSPDEDAVNALTKMQTTGNSRLMVAEDGRLVGVVTLKDLLQLLSLKIDLEAPG